MLESLGVFVSSEDFAALVSRYDGANSGTVNYEELVRPPVSESVQRGTGIDWVFHVQAMALGLGEAAGAAA